MEINKMENGVLQRYSHKCRKPRIVLSTRRIQSDEVTEILREKKNEEVKRPDGT